MTNKLINNNTQKIYLTKHSVKKVYDLLKKLYFIDIMLCYNKNQIRNIFRFKVE